MLKRYPVYLLPERRVHLQACITLVPGVYDRRALTSLDIGDIIIRDQIRTKVTQWHRIKWGGEEWDRREPWRKRRRVAE